MKFFILFSAIMPCFLNLNLDTSYPVVFQGFNQFSASLGRFYSQNQTRFLISAPRWPPNASNSEAQIFSCGLENSSASCERLHLKFNHENQANGGFPIGSSLSSTNNYSLACSHLKLNQREKFSNFPNGGCILFSNSNQPKFSIPIQPFADHSFQIYYKTYYYSHAMAGFSSFLDEKSKLLVVGAPGFWAWRGAIVLYDSLDTTFSSPLIRYPIELRSRADTYFGFSIASGRPFDDQAQVLAVGGPQFEGTGAVWFFRLESIFNSVRSAYIRNAQFLQGNEFGGYFGSSLLFMDSNNDGLDELFVGEPYYSAEDDRYGDHGRVFMYMSDGKTLTRTKMFTGNGRSNSKFGYAIATLGDLNQDGYRDLVIGAPSEDKTGSVYVYHGQKNGIASAYSQRISGKEHFDSLNLRGFGMSILSEIDVDKNHYPDLLVGAPISKKAVLIRSKPIATVKVDLKFSKLTIDMSDRICSGKKAKVPCFNISYCIELKGKHLYGTHDVKAELFVDSLYGHAISFRSRAYLKVQEGDVQSFWKTFHLKPAKSQCTDPILAVLKDDVADLLTPMEITLNLETILKDNHFCSSCPVIVNQAPIREKIAFQTGCGVDGYCLSKVHISTKLQYKSSILKSIVEGLHENVILRIEVENSGENAHSAKLKLTVEPPLKLVSNAYEIIDLNEESETILIDAGNPLTKGKVEFSITFDAYSIEEMENVSFKTYFTTRSNLDPSSIIKQVLKVPIQRYAAIEIVNSPSEPFFFDHPEIRLRKYVTFYTSVTVIKSNYSSVKHTAITLDIPISFKNGKKFLFKPKIESLSIASLNCDLHSLELETIPEDTTIQTPMPEAFKYQRRSERSLENTSLSNETVAQRIQLELNCQTANCQKVFCMVGALSLGRRIVTLRIVSAVNLEELERYLGKDITKINLTIRAQAKIMDFRFEPKSDWISAEPTSVLIERLPYKEPIPFWILLASSFIGSLFLLLIILVLIKIGFFHRKKKEELQELSKRMSRIVSPNSLRKLERPESAVMEDIDLGDVR